MARAGMPKIGPRIRTGLGNAGAGIKQAWENRRGPVRPTYPAERLIPALSRLPRWVKGLGSLATIGSIIVFADSFHSDPTPPQTSSLSAHSSTRLANALSVTAQELADPTVAGLPGVTVAETAPTGTSDEGVRTIAGHVGPAACRIVLKAPVPTNNGSGPLWNDGLIANPPNGGQPWTEITEQVGPTTVDFNTAGNTITIGGPESVVGLTPGEHSADDVSDSQLSALALKAQEVTEACVSGDSNAVSNTDGSTH